MNKTHLSYTFSSSLDELDRLPDILDQITEAFSLDNETAAKLMLTVSEAVTNGIKHGNELTPEKEVYLNVMLLNSKHLQIKVKDQGDGFNPEEVPDPLAEENLLKPSGRGVYLMKEYADQVSYNAKGNELILTFNLP